MKILHGMIAVLGICLVSISSVVLPVDDPETAYNESETPVSLATPVSISDSTNVQLTLLATRPTTMFRGQRVRRDYYAAMYAKPVVERTCGPHSRFKLCYTLLC